MRRSSAVIHIPLLIWALAACQGLTHSSNSAGSGASEHTATRSGRTTTGGTAMGGGGGGSVGSGGSASDVDSGAGHWDY